MTERGVIARRNDEAIIFEAPSKERFLLILLNKIRLLLRQPTDVSDHWRIAMTYLMEFKTYHTYIVTNKNHTVLYTGVTSALRNRIGQHKHKFYPHSFTARYNADELVYYEAFFDIGEAIAREKQIKGGSRQKKLDLINAFNANWRDLYEDLD